MAAARARFDHIRSGLAAELGPLLQLAGPVVLAELGWMTMGIIDIMLVGRVRAEAIGAVSIGGSVYFPFAMFGMGLLLGLDYLVAQAFGAGRLEDCHGALIQGVYLSIVAAVPLTAIVRVAMGFLDSWGLQPEVLRQTIPFLKAVTWSLLPLFLFSALRRYLQGMGIVRPVMITLITANLINIGAGWILVFGHCGVRPMGAEGAGWATCAARVYMALSLLAYIFFNEVRRPTGLLRTSARPDLNRLRHIVQLGLPAALQMTLEVGVFALATALAGKLDALSLAAHQVALTIAAFTFMIPLGVSSAGAVRVGHAMGRRDPAAAARAGWTSLLVGAGFMACSGLAFISFPAAILGVFTTDRAVIATGVSLLFVAAIFQLFDGVQVVATGILRGTGDTRTPMICNLIGHWFLGLPIGYTLAFVWRRGLMGLWVGLCTGLIAVALVLLWVWIHRVRTLAIEFSDGVEHHAPTRQHGAVA